MGIAWGEGSEKANGGTEQMGRELEKRLDPALLSEFQIFPSRVTTELDPTKIRVLWCHDTAGDPMYDHLKGDGWRKFHKLVFVSNWQMQAFIGRYGIPWSRCAVLQNAIEPLQLAKPWQEGETVRLIYTSTPHRGLNILYAAFQHLAEEDPDVTLDVYSSFGLYGWDQRDAEFQPLFDAIDQHPKVTSHGSVSPEELRSAVEASHIFAYPSTWSETSCRCLIEAMSAGLTCVHSNLAALPETAANWTMMYQLNEDQGKHAFTFYQVLKSALSRVRQGLTNEAVKSYADMVYGWDFRVKEWTGLLTSLLDEPREIIESPVFSYRS
jgi:glycosyltransferase involved in cell wall biosynthesis